MIKREKPDFKKFPASNGPEDAIKAFLRACRVCESHLHRDEHGVRRTLRFVFQQAHKDYKLRQSQVLAREVRRKLNARTPADKFLDFIGRYLR